MTFFEGDLLSGDLALRNVQGMVATDRDPDQQSWTGHFEVSAENAVYLSNDEPYLLLLEDGQSARVMLTEWQPLPNSESLNVRFEPV